MDDCYPGFAVCLRMGVFHGWSSVRCPSGMSDSYSARHLAEFVDGVHLIKSASVFFHVQFAVCYCDYSYGVVSSIF